MRHLIHLLASVSMFWVSGAAGLGCNVTLRVSYFDYRLRASCRVACDGVPRCFFGFRERNPAPRLDEEGRRYTCEASLNATGSFWGEYLQCGERQIPLYCSVRIAVNVTVTLHCEGANGVWPPFAGPYDDGDPPYQGRYELSSEPPPTESPTTPDPWGHLRADFVHRPTYGELHLKATRDPDARRGTAPSASETVLVATVGGSLACGAAALLRRLCRRRSRRREGPEAAERRADNETEG